MNKQAVDYRELLIRYMMDVLGAEGHDYIASGWGAELTPEEAETLRALADEACKRLQQQESGNVER